jgi:uncharacterized tellurite resistance protein B-like protein
VSLLAFFGLGRSSEPQHQPTTASAKRIASELAHLDRDEARYVATFAYLLGRIARADLQITADESDEMRRILAGLAQLSLDQAEIVVEIVRNQAELFGGTENFLVAREFNEIATRQQKLNLLECLFAVAAADGSVSASEDDEIRRLANELCLPHGDFIAARRQYREHLAVLREKK